MATRLEPGGGGGGRLLAALRARTEQPLDEHGREPLSLLGDAPGTGARKVGAIKGLLGSLEVDALEADRRRRAVTAHAARGRGSEAVPPRPVAGRASRRRGCQLLPIAQRESCLSIGRNPARSRLEVVWRLSAPAEFEYDPSIR